MGEPFTNKYMYWGKFKRIPFFVELQPGIIGTEPSRPGRLRGHDSWRNTRG